MKTWGRAFVGALCVMMVAVAWRAYRTPDASARDRVSEGNELFAEGQFIGAAVAYQQALTEVERPDVHYNLGLTYAKIFKPGSEQRVLLGTENEVVCKVLPQVKMVKASACVNDGDRHYTECGAAMTAPIEQQIAELNAQVKTATEARKNDLQALVDDKRAELGRYTCAASSRCVQRTFCSLTSPELAGLAAQHLQLWIDAQPRDDASRERATDAHPRPDQTGADQGSGQGNTQPRLDASTTKDQARKLMTQLWIESDQYGKATAYWERLLQQQPDDAAIMGMLSGIELKAGDWRKSIMWRNKEALATKEPGLKAAAYQFIGNVAWVKLNSRALVGADAVELADRGIAALQRAAAIQPDNAKLPRLQAALFNFRSVAHGSSWAAAIDRASALQLVKLARVVSEQAKNAQGPPPSAPTAPGTAPPAPAGGAAGHLGD